MSDTEKPRFTGGASLTDPPQDWPPLDLAELLVESLRESTEQFFEERRKENLREFDAIRWRLVGALV